MTEKVRGINQEDASLLLGLSTAKSTAPVTAAGRELDALMAEKVMGLLEVHARGAQWVSRSLELEALHGGRFFAPVPPYSTSIADAWLVVEKLREGLWWFELTDMPGDPNTVRATAAFTSTPLLSPESTEHFVVAETPALAICLAALKAVGG